MTTGNDIIEEARQHLLTGQNERINILDTNITNVATSLNLRLELRGVVDNAVLSIGIEELLVTAVSSNAPGSAVTVIRGCNGSTPVAHNAGDLVRVNSKFPAWRLFKETNNALQEVSSPRVGLFQIKSIDFDFIPSQAGYNLPVTDMIDIWRVRSDTPGPLNDWPVFRRDEWRLDQAADTTEFAQGQQLVLKKAGYPGHKIRVSYKAKFGVLAAGTDDILSVAGLHTEAHRLLPYVVAIGAAIGRELKRSFTDAQPEPRRAEEVPMSAASQAVRHLQARADEIIQDELARLHQRYPEQL